MVNVHFIFSSVFQLVESESDFREKYRYIAEIGTIERTEVTDAFSLDCYPVNDVFKSLALLEQYKKVNKYYKRHTHFLENVHIQSFLCSIQFLKR